MHHVSAERQILALTYTDGDQAAAVLRRLRARLFAAGAVCAGILQHDEASHIPECRCDMILECLSSGERIRISENRGAHARGCRLDLGELVRAVEIERRMLSAKPDVLIINKFGKSESEGGGFRSLIADAVELGLPILVTVPWRNIENWRLFAGELSIERNAETMAAADDADALAAIGLIVKGEGALAHMAEPSIATDTP